jgi:hypothetical protein
VSDLDKGRFRKHPQHLLHANIGAVESRGGDLVLHADDAADSLSLRHQVEGLVDLRERNAVRDELLHLQLLMRTIASCSSMSISEYDNSETGQLELPAYLLHVHLHDIGQVSTWFEVAEEGALQGPLVQEIHWVGLEFGVLVWHTHQNSYAPALYTDHRFSNEFNPGIKSNSVDHVVLRVIHHEHIQMPES